MYVVREFQNPVTLMAISLCNRYGVSPMFYPQDRPLARRRFGVSFSSQQEAIAFRRFVDAESNHSLGMDDVQADDSFRILFRDATAD